MAPDPPWFGVVLGLGLVAGRWAGSAGQGGKLDLSSSAGCLRRPSKRKTPRSLLMYSRGGLTAR